MDNGVPVTLTHENYNYRAYLESLLNYGTDVVLSHLSNSYWYLDNVDMRLAILQWIHSSLVKAE